ncbi:MAG: exonuclease domain-containing protein, partial [Candidatus Krumholzibacteriia bacterium]
IHGISDEDVAREPEFRQIAGSLAEYLEGCDLAGFGILQFDLPMLRTEFERADVEFSMEGRRILDAKSIYHAKEPRTLTAAHDYYCGEPFEDAHSAEADALATYRVLVGQLERYDDLPHSIGALHKLCNPREADFVDSEGKLLWQGDEVYFNFGKHRGESLREVCVTDPKYVDWLTSKDFRAELKSILAAAMQGQLPERGSAPVAEGRAAPPRPDVASSMDGSPPETSAEGAARPDGSPEWDQVQGRNE